MPRVDLSTHYRRHRLLRLLWLQADSAFGLLKPSAQWELHELYQPSIDLVPEELDHHIAGLRRKKPSLINRAGKHYKSLEQIYVSLVTAGIGLEGDGQTFRRAINRLIANRDIPSNVRGVFSSAPISHSSKRVIAIGIARPKPDVQKLATAFMMLAEVEANKRKGA